MNIPPVETITPAYQIGDQVYRQTRFGIVFGLVDPELSPTPSVAHQADLLDTIQAAFWLQLSAQTNQESHFKQSGSLWSVPDIEAFLFHQPQGEAFQIRDEWSDEARRVWISNELRCTLTYVEGDIILVHCHDDNTFQNRLDADAAFYAIY